jgi:hypothetical protein
VRLNCDTLRDAFDDQMLLVHSAAPGTPEAEALALLRVLGIDSREVPRTGPPGASDGRATATDRLTDHPIR